MKQQDISRVSILTVFLFILVLALSPSCKLFHFTRINPYNDFTTDQLSKYEVSNIKIIIPDSLVIFPGTRFPIGVIAETSFRKKLATRGLCKGYVNWNSYAVQVEGGKFENGEIVVSSNPLIAKHFLKISVTPFYYPELKQEMELPISYKTNFVANCKGQNGLAGYNGLSGAELHQMDTAHIWKSFDGLDGQVGTNGETGNDGCLADVFVKAMNASGKKLMNVLVINHCNNSHTIFWIDPDGGSLLIDVSGGDGGNGGTGGDGENGTDGAGASYTQAYPAYYPGQIEFNPKYVLYNGPYAPYIDLTVDSTRNPSGNGGNGGFGGNGGNAGNGGNGGLAIIHLDSSAMEWKNKITVNYNGGNSGQKGSGGFAGSGGRAAYGMLSKLDGENGFIGADGKKAEAGKIGTPTIWRIEKVKMTW